MPDNEGPKPLIVKVVSETVTIGDSLALHLRSIRIYIEWHLKAIIFLGLLIIGSACTGFFVKPWLSCLINLVAGGFSVWFGYTAFIRVKEIKILERKG
jgi:hypothetical protein